MIIVEGLRSLLLVTQGYGEVDLGPEPTPPAEGVYDGLLGSPCGWGGMLASGPVLGVGIY